jgi:hypothetical protein
MPITFLNISKQTFLKKQPFLFRFSTIERTLELLNENVIVFRNPEQWNDPFEKLFITATFRINNNVYSSPLKERIYCTCFTGTNNSEAFWNTYTPNRDGIRIKMNTEVLLKHLESIEGLSVYIGKVNYKFTDQIKFDRWEKEKDAIINGIPNETFVKLMLQKRKAFKYEDEYRIILISERKLADQDIRIGIERKGLVSTLLLHPLTGKYTNDVLKKYLKANFSVKVSQSILYQPKSIEFTLTK